MVSIFAVLFLDWRDLIPPQTHWLDRRYDKSNALVISELQEELVKNSGTIVLRRVNCVKLIDE